MNGKHLGYVILFGTFVLTSLLAVQVYWFGKAFSVADRQFDHSVQVALKRVADSVSPDAVVQKLSSNFFFVATESELNDLVLDEMLRREFSIRKLDTDYELGVYDADDDTLVYGNYVRATKPLPTVNSSENIHSNEKNFAVYFPGKNSFVVAQLDIWIFSTVVLLLMMGFFAYAIYSLLRERKFAVLKSDFINNMTHEFKTPVTNIRIAGEILKKKIHSADAMDVYVDILLKENEKLREKIDAVLLGSSADHLRRPRMELVDVHQLISDCAEAFQLKIDERNGFMQLQLNALDSTILADRDLLTQAINNVIDNAEKYSPTQPHIIVITKDSHDGIEINIVDTGVGIAAGMKKKVFEKFFRIRTGDLHNVKGFGLGLSFVKNVIRSHHGQISLFSEINKGTEVRILLPKA